MKEALDIGTPQLFPSLSLKSLLLISEFTAVTWQPMKKQAQW